MHSCSCSVAVVRGLAAKALPLASGRWFKWGRCRLNLFILLTHNIMAATMFCRLSRHRSVYHLLIPADREDMTQQCVVGGRIGTEGSQNVTMWPLTSIALYSTALPPEYI